MFFLRFAYFQTFFFTIPALLFALFYRIKYYQAPIYNYSLTSFLKQKNLNKITPQKTIFFLLRLSILILLLILVARPQWVDSKSKVNVEGIDIAITLDVSGSMQMFDDPKDQRTRIDVAKKEAIRFIEKRPDDPIAIVIFGRDALSRCPLTLDKKILKETVSEIKLGYINPAGTALGTGLATAINRLRKSKAKTKIIILLTDGQPTPEQIDPEQAIEMAKQYGIKIYTIGVGNKQGGFANHPFYGIVRSEDSIDPKLLKKIALQTGGKYFRANNPKDMRQVYNKIDQLEKTEYQTDIFNRYYEAFINFIWILLLLIGIELFLKLYLWRGITN